MQKINLKIWFFLSTIISPLNAQNYQVLSSSRTSCFINSYGFVECVRIDSMINDPITYLYPNATMRNKEDFYCFDPLGPNWIGSPILIMDNGYNCFINKWGDTIKIKTNAAHYLINQILLKSLAESKNMKTKLSLGKLTQLKLSDSRFTIDTWSL